MESPTFYNIAQAAEVIRMRYHSVWRMIHRGEIRAFKVGSRWRIPVDFMDGFQWTTREGS